jgi:hypothetical protein
MKELEPHLEECRNWGFWGWQIEDDAGKIYSCYDYLCKKKGGGVYVAI